MKNDYDADDEKSAQGDEAGGLRWMTVAVALLVVGGFFALAWYAYRSSAHGPNDALETIQADAGPVKDKPKDPGGMDIPYQDMSVYNNLSDPDKKEHKVEQLLPDPEEPMANGAPTPSSPVQAPVAATSAKTDTQVFIKGDASTQVAAPTAVKDVPVATTPVAPATVMPAVTKKPEGTTPSSAKPAVATNRFMDKSGKEPAAAASGSVTVQLAALKSAEEAEKTWAQVKAKFPTPLAGKAHTVVKADLPSGTFYRLRASGFSTDAAKKLCADMAQRKQPCMIVR